MRSVTESLSWREKEQLGSPHWGPATQPPPESVLVRWLACFLLCGGWNLPSLICAHCSPSRCGTLCRASPVPGTWVSDAWVVPGQVAQGPGVWAPGVTRLVTCTSTLSPLLRLSLGLPSLQTLVCEVGLEEVPAWS